MGDDIVMTAFRWFFQIMKWIVPFLFKSGLIYPMAVGLIGELVGYENISPWIYVPLTLLSYYLCIQAIVRWVKKDKKLKLWQVLLGGHRRSKEEDFTNPKVNPTLAFQEPTGAVFGRMKAKWVCKPEQTDGHILVCGGPGSGKSACVAIPTLLSWGQESNAPIFAIDIKGELQQKTKHRRPNSKVFSLTLHDGCGYNPFYLIDENRNLVTQIKDIATALIPIPPEEKNPFWKQNAQNYLTGCLLFAYKRGIPFADIMEMIQGTPPDKMAIAICEDENREPKLFMNHFADMAHDTLSGIFAEVSNVVLPFATDEQLREALSKPREDCISPADLDNGTSIYIHLEEHRLEQLRNFLTLLVNQFLKHFEMRSEEDCNRVLFMLDEFPRLGKIDSIMNGMATLRSKGITIALIFQSLAQLDVIYGQPQRKVIVDNASYIALLRVTDVDTAKNFADMIGTYDKSKTSYSDNKQDLKVLGSTGTSTTTEEKRIIKPEELNRLDNELILISPFGFNRVTKTYYFKEPTFQNLMPQ